MGAGCVRTPSSVPMSDISRLLEIMAALRTPGTGCPWDLRQDFASIAPYTIEEAYEVADAIERESLADLCEELGDLLLQVVFHARMAQEQGVFEFDDVVRSLNAKLVRRHPHVFGDARGLTSGGVEEMWEQIKSKEREEKDARRGAVSHKQKEKMAADDARADGARSVLAGISVALPALTRACKLQARAAKVGFDWNDWRPVLAKIREEANEIEGALASGDSDEAAAEVGDLLFAVTNLARHLGIDPEAALRGTNRKFERRFAAVEAALSRRGKAPQQSTLAEMDELWNEAKLAEREQRTNAAE